MLDFRYSDSFGLCNPSDNNKKDMVTHDVKEIVNPWPKSPPNQRAHFRNCIHLVTVLGPHSALQCKLITYMALQRHAVRISAFWLMMLYLLIPVDQLDCKLGVYFMILSVLLLQLWGTDQQTYLNGLVTAPHYWPAPIFSIQAVFAACLW